MVDDFLVGFDIIRVVVVKDGLQFVFFCLKYVYDLIDCCYKEIFGDLMVFNNLIEV